MIANSDKKLKNTKIKDKYPSLSIYSIINLKQKFKQKGLKSYA